MLATVVVGACAPDIPERDAPEDRVQAIFDPATATIPLPNDAALQEGRLPTLEGTGEASAQGSFGTYLTELSGWMPSTPIEIPFSGALNTETLTDENVLFYRFDGGLEPLAVASVEALEASGEGPVVVRVTPAEPVVRGERYAVIVTKGVEGANGASVIEPLPIFYAASKTPLVDADGEPTLDVLVDPENPGQALQLEGLRQLLAPLFESAEGQGIAREQIAMAFSWTVSSDSVALFDPVSAQVPLPNDAALDPDGSFPDSAGCFVDAQTANGELDRYLAGLSGWPASTPITLPLSKAIDPADIGEDDVQLWRVGDGGVLVRVEDVSVTYVDELSDRCTGETGPGYALVLTPSEPMQDRERYFAFATRSIGGEAGLLPDLPMFMAMQPYPLVDASGSSLVGSLSDEQAQAIAGIKQSIAPMMAHLEGELGLTYEELAAVWGWGTWDDTFVVFDPNSGSIAFPSAFLVNSESGQIELPVPEGADALTTAIIGVLNQRRGFSTTAPGWIPVDGQVDESTIDAESVVMASVRGFAPRVLPADEYALSYDPQWGHLVVEPQVPLAEELQHAGIVTTAMLGANGRPVQPTAVFALLRSPYPLVDAEGTSLVYLLDDATAGALEVARSAYARLFLLAGALPGGGIDRSEIATAWAFVTEDPVAELQESRAVAMALLDARASVEAVRACDSGPNCVNDAFFIELESESLPHPTSAGTVVDVSNLEAIYAGGEFDSVVQVDAVGTVIDPPAGTARVGVSVFLPRAVQDAGECQAPFDVVIAQHGLGGNRWSGGLMVANDVAAYPSCKATVAIDLPLHGGRASAATTLHPDEAVSGSGAGFLGADLLTSKVNFAQASLDLFVLARIIAGDGVTSGLEALFADTPYGGEALFGFDVGFVGQSLGGIVGVPFVTLEPTVDTATFSAAGGRLTWILEGDDQGPSTIGGPILDALATLGAVPGTFEFIRTMALVQWTADVVDPVAFAPFTVARPRANLAYDLDSETFGPVTGELCAADDECPSGWQCESVSSDVDRCVEYLPENQVLVQMAQGDRTVVNRATQALARALGVSLEETTFEGAPHSFLSTLNPERPGYAAGQCARAQVAAWLASGMSGVAELPASLSAATCLGQ
ncbi:hypothetical protein DL240_04130 [Lujinxingia litoralis]|uniref:Bacterial virulence factor lipase N-terminal domain-containing protein n=1 Tax=Lujinxingia litoralis TaxID=2211119 RepID=A0A328C9U7_9DELT|nr:hypothetical protein DL240_04130 [Lujinxingia litoralis]